MQVCRTCGERRRRHSQMEILQSIFERLMCDMEVHIKMVAIILELRSFPFIYMFFKPLVGPVMSVSLVKYACRMSRVLDWHTYWVLWLLLLAAASNQCHSTFSPKVHFELYNAITRCHYPFHMHVYEHNEMK